MGGGTNKLPYNVYPDFLSNEITQERWKRHRWNPGQYDPYHFKPDNNASAKPTLNELYTCALIVIRNETVEEFRIWTRLQICAGIFGAHDILDELFNHYQGNYTEAQNNHKNAVVGVHNAQRDLLLAVTDLDHINGVYETAEEAIRISLN